jgi:hypothetical protein
MRDGSGVKCRACVARVTRWRRSLSRTAGWEYRSYASALTRCHDRPKRRQSSSSDPSLLRRMIFASRNGPGTVSEVSSAETTCLPTKWVNSSVDAQPRTPKPRTIAPYRSAKRVADRSPCYIWLSTAVLARKGRPKCGVRDRTCHRTRFGEVGAWTWEWLDVCASWHS